MLASALGSISADACEWLANGRPMVSLVTVHNGGHTIPQSVYRFPRLLGRTFESDAVIDYIWRFFDLPDS